MDTYRVYLRWPGQRVSDKTVTPSAAVAEAAFWELHRRADLEGQPVCLAVAKSNKQLLFHRFDSPAGEGAFVALDQQLSW